MFKERSPLAESLAAGARIGATGVTGASGATVRLGELQDWCLVQVGSYAHSLPALDAAISPLIGAPLPQSPRAATQSGAHRLYRIAADQYWIVTRDRQLPEALALAVPGEVGSVLDLSHARVRLALTGPGVRTLLAKVVSVDLRPQSFAVGQFVQTGLHHTGVLLERLAPEHFELYVLRTYALSIWEWLTDAAGPLGFAIVGTNAKEQST